MDLYTAISLGAAGGALVEAIAVWTRVNSWQELRREERELGIVKLSTLRRHLDFPVLAAVGITRLVLGAAAGAVFHEQLIGVAAAIAVGASGPALLQQLGAHQSLQSVHKSNSSLDHGVSKSAMTEKAETT
ncbi:hypothetical protein [Amycolatopsis sp. NPDC051061]|uniref:hypothetical protein n=1 Tax=Amycolatopsis sp. NPDC051061 TaxID=3155042 RepID=UPI0034127872